MDLIGGMSSVVPDTAWTVLIKPNISIARPSGFRQHLGTGHLGGAGAVTPAPRLLAEYIWPLVPFPSHLAKGGAMRTRIVALICVLFCITAQAVIADGLVPITTSSSEARAAYLRARDLFENLRNIEARADLQAALAWIAVAQASTSAQEFFENVSVRRSLRTKCHPARGCGSRGSKPA